jgi:molecular chaperone DnaK
MIYQAEKVLAENAERIPPDEKTNVDSKLEALRQAAKGSDTAAIRSAMDEFNTALQAISQHIYAEAGATGGRPPGGDHGEPGKPEDVVDAEYREVK